MMPIRGPSLFRSQRRARRPSWNYRRYGEIWRAASLESSKKTRPVHLWNFSAKRSGMTTMHKHHEILPNDAHDDAVAHGGEPTPSAWLALASLSLPMLLSSLGTSIANVALPTLTEAFGVSFQAAQWI